MSYSFKTLQELGWAVAVAVLTYLGTINFGGLNPTDWKAWGPAILAGAGRAVLAAIIAFISPTGGFQTK